MPTGTCLHSKGNWRARTINAKRITQVPLNGLSYTDLLALHADVNPATTNLNVSAGYEQS